MVDKPAVKIDVGINALVHLALSGNQFRREALNSLVQSEFLVFALRVREFRNEFLENFGARVGDGINGMADSVDQTGIVKFFLI